MTSNDVEDPFFEKVNNLKFHKFNRLFMQFFFKQPFESNENLSKKEYNQIKNV